MQVARTTTARRPATARSRWYVALAASLMAVAAYPLLARLTPASADPVADAQAQADALAAQIDAQGRQESQLAEQYDVARIRVDQVNGQVAAARAELAQTQDRVTTIENRLRQEAVTSYMDGNSAQSVAVFKDPRYEALVRQQYIDAVSGDARQTLDRLHSARQALQSKQQALQKDQQTAQAALDAAAGADRAAAAQTALEKATLARVKGNMAALVAQAQQRRQAQALTAFAAGATKQGAAGPAPPSSGGASTAVYWGEQEVGKPYQYGAAGPDSFDCSGLTMWAWEHAGVSLPHSSSGQYQATSRVATSDLQPGDLIFEDYGGGGAWPGHVGLYVGNGQMVVADHSGTNVQYAPIFRGGYVGAGRVR